ncbi:MAG: hypothetical protein PHC64_09105 [Candidatus Gastranaerophilales bacterium]|nr:hypothetical protein [Candidatus Gastranaerophilales bacterium]
MITKISQIDNRTNFNFAKLDAKNNSDRQYFSSNMQADRFTKTANAAAVSFMGLGSLKLAEELADGGRVTLGTILRNAGEELTRATGRAGRKVFGEKGFTKVDTPILVNSSKTTVEEALKLGIPVPKETIANPTVSNTTYLESLIADKKQEAINEAKNASKKAIEDAGHEVKYGDYDGQGKLNASGEKKVANPKHEHHEDFNDDSTSFGNSPEHTDTDVSDVNAPDTDLAAPDADVNLPDADLDLGDTDFDISNFELPEFHLSEFDFDFDLSHVFEHLSGFFEGLADFF